VKRPPRFFWGFDWSDLLVNLCLYLPLGLLLARAELAPFGIAMIALLCSGSIELLQATMIPGRRSAVDLAVNFLGAMAGVACYLAALRVQASRTREAFAMAAAALGLPMVIWAVSGLLLAPRPPDTLVWWGQWAHLFAGRCPSGVDSFGDAARAACRSQ
jgi:glycopeptide antibiotics resistance protein